MSEPETENDGETGPELIASADDLRAIDLQTVLRDLDRADDYAAEQALSKAADAAAGAGNKAAERGYRLLMLLCTLHLRVDDPAETWGPRWQSPEGRSYTGSDFRGEQTTVLGGFIDHIAHPVLRARVADVVWYNDRSQRGAVSAAISAYCETIARRIDGTFSPRFEDHDDSVLEMVDLFHRALQLHALSRRREPLSQDIRTTFEALYERTRLTSQYVAFEKTAYLGIRYALAEWSRVAPEAEQLAEGRAGGDYPMAVQGIWDLAAKGYASLGDDPAKRRCQVRSVDETLRMREQVGSSSAQAYWTRKAVGELRAAGGFKDRIEVLRTELRNLQDAALDEYGQFSIPLDLSAERKGTIELFEGLTLPDILLQFAIFATSPKVEDLRSQALESRKTSVLGSLFGASYADREGKTIAETPAMGLDENPGDEWFKGQLLQYLDLWRHQIVSGFIEPARQTVMTRFPLEERHFGPIVGLSPFVPTGHEHLFTLGFARFWQGDFASAAYLLIPQLESSLRHVLLNANRDSSKIKPDLLQEDRSLSGLLENQRSELEAVFGPNLINEIDLLFHYKPGPALRHDAAHGKLTAGACYHASGIYACWLIYQMTCLPLVRYWEDQVAPALEQAAL